MQLQIGKQFSAVIWTKTKVAVRNVVAPAPTQSQQSASTVRCVMSTFHVLTRGVSDLSNVTPSYLVSEKVGRISWLWLTFSSRLAFLLLRWKTANTVFVVLSFSFQVWKYSPTVAMSLLSTPSTACQSPPAGMIVRSSAYTYFLETAVGRPEMSTLNRRGCQDGSLWDVILEA